ncbi:WASP homolog-associated protein with actin, partial [Tropilaelaps mercedesae]
MAPAPESSSANMICDEMSWSISWKRIDVVSGNNANKLRDAANNRQQRTTRAITESRFPCQTKRAWCADILFSCNASTRSLAPQQQASRLRSFRLFSLIPRKLEWSRFERALFPPHRKPWRVVGMSRVGAVMSAMVEARVQPPLQASSSPSRRMTPIPPASDGEQLHVEWEPQKKRFALALQSRRAHRAQMSATELHAAHRDLRKAQPALDELFPAKLSPRTCSEAQPVCAELKRYLKAVLE